MSLSNLEFRYPKTYANDLVGQKIRLLNASAKFLEKISDMLKKNFIHLGLDKKKIKKFRACFDKFIKMISFTICFLCFFLFFSFLFVSRTKFGLLNFKSI